METPSRKGRLRAPAGGGRIVASGLGTVASSQEAALVGQAKSRRPTDPRPTQPPAKRPWIGGGWNGDPTTFTVGGRFCPASRIASPVCALHPSNATWSALLVSLKALAGIHGMREGSGAARDAGGAASPGVATSVTPRAPRLASLRSGRLWEGSPVQPQAEPARVRNWVSGVPDP